MDEILELLADVGMGFLFIVVVVFVAALVLVTREALREINGKDKADRS
jgi:hypothetical protein